MKKPKSKSKRKPNAHHAEAAATTNPGDFPFNITKVAVSQICKSVGFKRIKISALETLTLVATKYLEALAKSAVSFSNAASRTQSNLLDLTNALHDLSSLHGGFDGASTLYQDDSLLFKSSVLEHLSGFVSSTDEIPFAKPIGRETETEEEVKAKEASSGFFLQRGAHVPDWLPGFPDVVACNEICSDKRVINNRGEPWERSSSVLGCRINVGFEDKRNGGELGKERKRVSFRIKCGRKRVQLNSYRGINVFNQVKDEEEEEEEEAEYKKSKENHNLLVYKRRKR